MIRDEENKRIDLYLKGQGLKVITYNRASKEQAAYWTIDGTEMACYIHPTDSKTEVIFHKIHEGSHHLTFINDYKRKTPKKLEAAVDAEAALKKGKILAKRHRQTLYDHEVLGLAWWDVIVRDVNIKIPKWKIEFQKEYDLFPYSYLLEHGVWPSRKLRKENRRELRAKWLPK